MGGVFFPESLMTILPELTGAEAQPHLQGYLVS